MRPFVMAVCFAIGAAGMAGTAYAARYYYAACLHESHGLLGFNGPRHADAVDAQRDCAAHREDFPRHRCTVQPIDY